MSLEELHEHGAISEIEDGSYLWLIAHVNSRRNIQKAISPWVMRYLLHAVRRKSPDIATCRQCGGPIKQIDVGIWQHVGSNPRHVAIPGQRSQISMRYTPTFGVPLKE